MLLLCEKFRCATDLSILTSTPALDNSIFFFSASSSVSGSGSGYPYAQAFVPNFDPLDPVWRSWRLLKCGLLEAI